MHKKIIFCLALAGALLFFAGIPMHSSIAQTAAQQAATQLGAAGGATGLSDTDPRAVVAGIIRGLLTLLGVIFLGLMIYGGFLWMTSSGNEESIEKAKTLIRQAIIGLAIVLSAFAITAFVTNALVKSSSGESVGAGTGASTAQQALWGSPTLGRLYYGDTTKK